MDRDAYFTGTSSKRYTFAEIAARVRTDAPQTLGRHIFVQLEALGLLEEFQHGTTPWLLPTTFAEVPSGPASMAEPPPERPAASPQPPGSYDAERSRPLSRPSGRSLAR